MYEDERTSRLCGKGRAPARLYKSFELEHRPFFSIVWQQWLPGETTRPPAYQAATGARSLNISKVDIGVQRW